VRLVPSCPAPRVRQAASAAPTMDNERRRGLKGCMSAHIKRGVSFVTSFPRRLIMCGHKEDRFCSRFTLLCYSFSTENQSDLSFFNVYKLTTVHHDVVMTYSSPQTTYTCIRLNLEATENRIVLNPECLNIRELSLNNEIIPMSKHRTVYDICYLEVWMDL
jgi:hypothetical protein